MGFVLQATATYRPRGDLGQFIAAFVTPGATAAALASAKFVLQEAQAICPVDTGFLRDSGVATVETTDKTVVGHVDFTAPYSAYVEYGTGIRGAGSPGAGPYPYNLKWAGQVASPFIRPALDTARAVIKELFRSGIALSLKL